MDGEWLKSFTFEIGTCLQRLKYLVETGRADDAKKLLPQFDELHSQALKSGVEVEFFEKISHIRLVCLSCGASHPPGTTACPEMLARYDSISASDGYFCTKARTSISGPMGGWTIDEHKRRFHAHITIELVIDSTEGHANVLPGDVVIQLAAVEGFDNRVAEGGEASVQPMRDPLADEDFEAMMRRMLHLNEDDPGRMGPGEV